jgi:formate hydrogenlyase subunit 6/NADH:ubiquinone oxidoreductase subunit I
MHTCPTNSLQPLGLEAGFSAWFSPVVTPRRGPCDPGCNACGGVCPTGAIARLPLAEKLKAKVGTARISRQRCLAWEMEKKCLICDEVCPFDAIEFRRPDGRRIAVPSVNENRCAGCGYCENFCPVRATPAITVAPMEAIRLTGGSYRAAARERGYILETGSNNGSRSASYIDPAKKVPNPLGENGLPPGFTE